MAVEESDIRLNLDANRFELDLGDGNFAVLEFQIAGRNIIYTHTEVPVAFEGQGIAGKLARTAMEYAKSEGYKVQALCPFVTSYVRRHPEYQSITWGYE